MSDTPYGTLDGVRSLLPKDQNITATTVGTVTDVTTWLTKVGGTVDVALLQGGYTSPATDATVQSALGLLVEKETSYLLMNRRSGTGTEDVPDTWWGQYHKEFMDTIALIRDGKWAATPTTSGSGNVAASVTMDAETSDDPDLKAKITIGYQW